MLSSLEHSYHCIYLAIKSSIIIVKLVGMPGVVLSSPCKVARENSSHKNNNKKQNKKLDRKGEN